MKSCGVNGYCGGGDVLSLPRREVEGWRAFRAQYNLVANGGAVLSPDGAPHIPG
jgi:hypothetical protein